MKTLADNTKLALELTLIFGLKALFVGVLMILLLFVQRTLAQPLAPTAQQEIAATYAKMAAAMKAKNVPEVLTFLAADYQQLNPQGTTTDRAQFAAELENTMSTLETITTRYTIKKLTLKGNEAVLDIAYVFTGETSADVDPQGKRHKIVATAPTRAWWIKTAAGWRLKQYATLPGGKLLIDGKLTKPKA